MMNHYITSIVLNPFYTANVSFNVGYNVLNLLLRLLSEFSSQDDESEIRIILPGTVEYELTKLDVLNTMNMTTNMLTFVDENYSCNRVIKHRITDIKSLVEEMHCLYEIIMNRIDQHKNKLFNTYRKLDVHHEVETLSLLNDVLIKRRNEFYDIIKLTKIDIGKIDQDTTSYTRVKLLTS